MQRLRSSPQGSVLGALNALFSPHPVSGAPSPQQAASQGMLGKIFGPQGGGTTTVPAGSAGTVRDVVTGQNAPQKVTVTGGGTSGAGAQDLKDAAREEKAAASDLSDAAGRIGDSAQAARDSAGQLRDSAGRSASAADKTAQAADDQRSAASDLRDASSGIRGVLTGIRGVFGRGGSGGGGGGGRGVTGFVSGHAGPFSAGLAGGIGPGILGLNAKTAGIVGLGGSLLGALPAVGAVGATLGIGGLGAGVIAAGAKQLIGSKNTKADPNAQGPLYAQAQQIKKTLQDTMQAAASGMLGPLKQAFGEIPGLLKGIEPALKSVFAGAGTLIRPLLLGVSDLAHMVLPALGQAFRAVGPLLRPLLDGLGGLLKGLLPGITTLLHAAMPAIRAFAQVLGTLGRDLGKMFAGFAPAIKASVQIFKPLMDILGALFPIVGKLAAVFAQALGPVFTQFAAVVKSLMPFLTTFGNVLAKLASAVLGDLVSAFTAVAQILKGIAPALTTFATALSGAFTVLENSGVFAALGDALENLAPLLAGLISQLLNGLTPLLPGLIAGLSAMSTIMVTALADGLQQILPPLTQLALVVLQALATSLPVVLPVLAHVFGFFTTATADAIAGIVKALSGIIGAIPKPALDTLAGLAATLLILKKTGVISLGFKLVGLGQKLWAWLTGGTVDVAAGGMQKAADTMTVAAGEMQRAADTMAGAGAEPGGGSPVGTAERSAGRDAATAGEAGAASAVSRAKSRAGKVAGRLGAAAVTYTVGQSVAQAAGGTGKKVIGGLTDVATGAIAGSSFGPEGTVIGAVAGTLKGLWDAAPAGFGKATAAANAFTASLTALRTASFGQKTGQEQMTASMARGGLTLESSKALTDAYTFAVSENGAKSAAAQGLRQAMIADFERQGFTASQASQLVAQYTTNIETNGESAQAKETARADLIADFVKSGSTAHAASGLVDALSRAVSGNGTAISDAQAARSNLITDLEAVGVRAPRAQQDVADYTDAIQQNGTRSQAAQSARQKLLQDLEGAGVDSRTARQLVDNLTTAIGKLHGKNIGITMKGDGSYTIHGALINSSGQAVQQAGGLHPTSNAAGGEITAGTTGTADDVPINVSRGEWVIRASSAGKYGPAAMDAVNQGTATIGYAQGGPVGGNLTPGYVSGMYGKFQDQMTTAMVTSMRSGIKAASAAAQAAASAVGGGAAGPGGGAPSANAALARRLYPAWGSGAEWAAWNAIAMAESGWNNKITNGGRPYNPYTVAYGIPQALPAIKMGAAANPPQSNPAAQINWMVGYIKSAYGDPIKAWAFHRANGYYAAGGPVQGGVYDKGGWLWPGMNMAVNNTGRPERVITGAGMDSLQDLLAMLVSHMSSAVSWLRSIAGGGTGGGGGTGLAGQANAAAGYPGITGAGFGLTRADLGLPATTDTSGSAGSSGADGSGAGSSGGGPASPPPHPAVPHANSVQKFAASAVKKLMKGYIWHNDLGQMHQARVTLNYLMDHTYDAQVGQVTFLDGLLAAAQKKKDKKSEAAAEKLLASQGVHIWKIQKAAKGDAARDAARKVTENLMRTYIAENDMTGAGQADTLLRHWSVGKYTAQISQIRHLDSLLAQYEKKKDTRDVKATEQLLRSMGVRKFALGGQITEPVVGFGSSGRVYQFGEAGPEYVTPGRGGDMTSELRALGAKLDRLTGVAAAIPRGTGEHVGAALGGAAQSASFRSRFPLGGY